MPKKFFPKDSDIKMGISLELVIHGNPTTLKLPTMKGRSKSCVYMITNKINSRIYIGQTTNIFNRMPRHYRDILSGEHICKEMVNDFKAQNQFIENLDTTNKYSPSDLFEFSILCYCRPSELTFYENILIRTLNPEYNYSKKKISYTITDIEDENMEAALEDELLYQEKTY